MGGKGAFKILFCILFFSSCYFGMCSAEAKLSRSGAAAGMVHQGLHLPGGAGTRAECGDAARVLQDPASHLVLFSQPPWFACC